VSAASVLEAAKGPFGGRGGGNPSAATAVGEPGHPLSETVSSARNAVRHATGK
jgi:hypothetical protein